jgi:hypothetical protein
VGVDDSARPQTATLVIDTIDWKWTYEIIGSV